MTMIVNVLGAVILSGLGVSAAYLTSGWVGYEVTLWSCAVLVFLGIVLGIEHSALEGVVFAGVYTGVGYVILKAIPQILPIYAGALAGMSLYGIVIGVWAGSKEAPRREAEQRALEQERASDKAAEPKRRMDWEEYRKHVVTLPVAAPKADIRECLEAFRTHLNRVWSQLPPDLFEPRDYGSEPIHTWLQRQFEGIVEKPLGCPISRPYGEYDDYADDLPGEETPEPEERRCQPMQIWVNGEYEFHCLVSVQDGWYYTEPPFDYVRAYADEGPDVPKGERFIAFDQASFELRPASWISES